MTDEFTLVFWGKYAMTAATFLDVGRCINVEAVPRPYSIDTGQTRADGKKIIHRITNFSVRSFEFGGDTKKELTSRITANLQKAKLEGLIPMDTTLTADYLIAIERPTKLDYNPATVATTGMYGNAKVYIKGSGFVKATGVVASPVVVGNGINPDDVDALQERVNALQKAKSEVAAAEAINAEVVKAESASAEENATDPFKGAVVV